MRTLPFAEAPLEIIDGDRGTSYPKQADFHPGEHCLFLNAGNVTTVGFQFTECSFVSAQKDAELRKGKLQRHDVVLTTRGTVGNVAYYDDAVPFDHVRINSGMVILRPNPLELLPRYLYLFIRSVDFQNQVAQLCTGSAQPQLPIRDIKRIELPLPPLHEQRTIAHILGTLDDKIELNRRMNETLEGIARAIFKSWFIDFDPVRWNMQRKEKGRNQPSPRPSPSGRGSDPERVMAEGPPGLPQHIADLFPDSFEDSELGEIPKGWEVKALGDVADVSWGDTNTTKKSYSDTGFIAYSAKGPDGFLPYFDFDRVGVVVSAIGANSGYTWLARGKWSCIKNTIRFWAKDATISTEYLFLATHGANIWPLRGSAQPFISQTDARNLRVLFPARGIAKSFGSVEIRRLCP